MRQRKDFQRIEGVNPKDRWPQTTGTRVYLLAQSIINIDAEPIRYREEKWQ